MTNIPPALQSMFSASKAKLLKEKNLNKHVSLSMWTNEHDYIEFQNTKHHTLSLYIKGGYNNFRLDKTISNISGENKLCLMPKDGKYIWSIGKPFQLGHLYFTDEYLKQIAMQTFDKDPRDIHLQELTFEENQTLASLMRYGIFENDWKNNQNHHFIDHAVQMILLKILQNHSNNRFKLPTVKGGLSHRNQTLIKDYIHTYFAENLPLSQLAALVGLSEYHFAHMFKTSFASAPHQYIQALRISNAATQIKAGIALVNVAANCGFSSQSHLGRIFKQYKGVTPHKYKLTHA
ncbi:MAG: helix-turn-helix transcriptional regulator [Alphaproteobacteria bacterium]|nr:helix-turn-helix transcriptional regulator [Alphaproteobacteria bacterium]